MNKTKSQIALLVFGSFFGSFLLGADKEIVLNSDSEKDSNQTEKKPENPVEPDKPKTVKVDRKDFEIKAELTGVFESTRMAEVSIPSKSWGELLVLEALPQGAKVKKGESLVTLEMNKIDEKILSMRNELDILELDRQIAQADLQLAELAIPMEMAELKRKNKETQEDFSLYQKTKKPHNEKAAGFTLKSYQDSLAYAQEELNQLKKMYEADDLTEETEEIILLRAKNAVERSKFSLEGAKNRHAEILKYGIPRETANIEGSSARSELLLQAALQTKPAELEKKRLEAKRLDRVREKASKSLLKLEHDRKLMKVPSPASGVLYRGHFDRGKWQGSETLKNRLRRGGILKPHEVFMTIIAPGKMIMRSSVTEKNFRKIKAGAKGQVISTAYPELKLEGKISEVSGVPIAPGKFDVKVDVSFPNEMNELLPGMTCKMNVVSYRKERALVVPSSAIFEVKGDPEKHAVYLHRAGKKPIRRFIKIGKKSGNQTEILGGLKHGQEILVEKPGQ